MHHGLFGGLWQLDPLGQGCVVLLSAVQDLYGDRQIRADGCLSQFYECLGHGI